MAREVKFLDMFGCCAALRDKCGGLELAKVKNVVVSRKMQRKAGWTYLNRNNSDLNVRAEKSGER